MLQTTSISSFYYSQDEIEMLTFFKYLRKSKYCSRLEYGVASARILFCLSDF